MNDDNSCQIMFVDRDEDWLAFAVQMLREQTIRALGVTDIDRAVRAFKDVHVLQLVLIDLESVELAPDRFRRFTKSKKRYVIVLFPTELTPYEMSRIFKLGAYDCVDKPYDGQSLIRLVESLLKEVRLLTWDALSSLAPNWIPAA